MYIYRTLLLILYRYGGGGVQSGCSETIAAITNYRRYWATVILSGEFNDWGILSDDFLGKYIKVFLNWWLLSYPHLNLFPMKPAFIGCVLQTPYGDREE